MAQQKEVAFPPGKRKFIGLAIAAIGITLYVFWTLYYLIPEKIYFDLGLFSISIVIFLFGIGFTWLFSAQDKKVLEDERKEKEKEKKKGKKK
jgi:hypothetical protein